MIDQKLDDNFSKALREDLVKHVRTSRRRRRTTPIASVSLAALILGGSIASASRTPGELGKPLARPVIETHVGSATVPLPPAPPDATNVRIVLSCMTPGRCQTPGGGVSGGDWATFEGPLMQADSLRLMNKPDDGNAQLLPPIDPSDGLNVSAETGVVWRVYAVYVDEYESDWFTNESGQTYGVPNNAGAPDLIAAWTDDGQLGYTPSDQLLGRDAEPQFHSAADVQTYVSGSSVKQRLPVFAEDGETLVGYVTVR
jgi:hypothetical protein